ncbi:hypothetical protein BC941DRAFT_466342 [Chlamydoabsidia padenii]|nr:hypothetical protein BC941DRAFT_466342 [Chlamydoabsidia padenii]
MTTILRSLRPFFSETPRKSASRKNRQHLQVKISKEPPTILYFEQSYGEQSCECIFDPLVCHDEEKDHPDLFMSKQQKELKPWQKPPYCSMPSTGDTLVKRLTYMIRTKLSKPPSSSVVLYSA